MDPLEVFAFVLVYCFPYAIAATFAFSACILCCSSDDPEEQQNAAAQEQATWVVETAAAVEWARRLVEAAEQARLAAAPAPAAVPPVVQKELGYFPYYAAMEASGQRLVCAICLDVIGHGAACSEVPACQHVFHRDCIGLWMKNGKSTCPLCRALIVLGSERLSAAEDMV